MITAYLAAASIRRQWKTDRKSRGNAQRARVADDDRMKVRAVSTPRIAGVIDITASPALSVFMVFDGGNGVFVDAPDLFKTGPGARRVDDLMRPPLYLAVNRHKPVGLKPSRHLRISIFLRAGIRSLLEPFLDMLL